jgi:two-component system, response regulator YesN
MIRTFIADDEPLILRSIKKTIEETNPNFKIIGQATDGHNALKLIQELNPDVIFTDIRMPVIDGLELIKQLREKGNQSTIVLLSGYKEFEYAKEAIRLSVVDYLIKPINPESLKTILEEIHQKWNQSLKQKQYDYLENLAEAKNDVKLFRDPQNYSAVYICLGAYAHNQVEPLYNLNKLVNFNEIIPKLYGGDDYWVLNGKFLNEKIILFSNNNPSQSGFIQQLYEEMKKRLYEYIPVTIMCSNEFTQITDFRAQVIEMEQHITERMIFAETVLIDHIQPLDEQDLRLPSEYMEELNLLRNLIKKKKYADIKLMVKNLLLKCEKDHFSQMLLTKLLKKACFILIQETAVELEVHEFVSVLIGSSKNYADLYRNFLAAYDEIMGLGNDPKQIHADSEKIVDEIQEYMNQFFNTNLSIQDIAKHFGFNYSYFCSLFKKFKNKSPNEYIIEKRIEMAKKLLITSDLNIKAIASFVGYEDQYYFSRIFKTIAGVTPSSYRKSAS